MIINRHNYEEFFLLYVDNELSTAGRQAVDLFVKNNPDLKIELEHLKQTILDKEDILLGKKNWLYKEQDISMLQQNLLLYADDELADTDKNALETLLATDIAALTEWNIIKQTKLEPDTSIVFNNKQLLYKHEGTKVISLKWWRVAAAAIFLGVVILGAISIYKNNITHKVKANDIAHNHKPAKIESPTQPTPDNSISPTFTHPAETTSQNSVIVSADNNVMKENTDAIQANNKQHVKPVNNSIANNTVLQNIKDKPGGNNLPKPYFENINNNSSNENIVSTVTITNNNTSKVSGNLPIVTRTYTNEAEEATIIVNKNKMVTGKPSDMAVTPVVNNKSSDNNVYLDVNTNREKRTALGGFLRKAKRIIERTTNANTGESLKIAGIEIALK